MEIRHTGVTSSDHWTSPAKQRRRIVNVRHRDGREWLKVEEMASFIDTSNGDSVSILLVDGEPVVVTGDFKVEAVCVIYCIPHSDTLGGVTWHGAYYDVEIHWPPEDGDPLL